MSVGAGTAAGSAAVAAAAAIAEAIKASGAIVRVEPHEFAKLLALNKEPLVVHAEGGFFSTNYQYLMGYRGLIFFCKSPEPLGLPTNVEVIRAKKIWIPG